MKSEIHIFIYPTESFYALGVKATDRKAIQHLFRVKHREKNKPIALIAADLKQVKRYFVLSKTELKLAKKFWPGALTLVLRPKKKIAANALFGTTPSRSSRATPPHKRRGAYRVGVRVPKHAGARALAKKVEAPITATSANISGQPPTKSLHKVKQAFPGILVTTGRCGQAKKPSTVAIVQHQKIHILRPGAVHVPTFLP